ncbi:MAG: TlpA family protein disulfide reductase [Deltaproteobacteria bacterium]|nr:TlpA family protein disulfide reductase [Deltaproteobacteria bacterium]
MKRILTYLVAVALCALIFNSPVLAAKSPPAKGSILPEIKLVIPSNHSYRSYLGLHASGFFKIPEIRARVVIIEIFSMYCPHCQGDAPMVNKLYRMIEDSPNLKGKIKLIGIGAGNSSYEVEVFRKTYDVPFPLFADGDFTIHAVLGEVRTPYFIGVKINDDGTHQVFYSKLGGVNEADQFLKMILRLSGLKKIDAE